MKDNTSMIDLQKQSYISKMHEQEHNHNKRIDQYEKKIALLAEEVRDMKELVRKEHRASPQNENRQKEYIGSLEAQLQLLSYENSRLKEEN